MGQDDGTKVIEVRFGIGTRDALAEVAATARGAGEDAEGKLTWFEIMADLEAPHDRARYEVEGRGNMWVICAEGRLLATFSSESLATRTAHALADRQA